MRTILFTGKGGVGKTTLSAATALLSAASGRRTLIISTDIAHSLADVLDRPLGNSPQQVDESGLYAAELDTGEELECYWGDVKRRVASILRDQGLEATVAGELAVLPGLDEVLALVRIKRYYDEEQYDALIIDSAPTGAAMRLLSAPDLNRWYTGNLLNLSRGIARIILPSIRKAIKLPIGEELIRERMGHLFDQVKQLRGILTDGEQTSVRLVLNPEHMALRETQRAYTYMNLFGFSVDAILVNRVLPDEVVDPYFAQWKESQASYRQETQALFAPLPVFEVPLFRQEIVGTTALADLATHLYGDIDPIAALSTERPLRFYMEDHRYMLALRVTGVSSGSVELEKHGDELRVRLGNFRRSLILPQYVAGMDPTWARVDGQYLKVAFEESEARPAD